jgi:dipeptidase
MCDTAVIVTPNSVFFAKNSDRDANEAQHLDWQPAREYPASAQLRCTYLTIPQVRRTHAVLLSRPYWCWGAEIATNEHGVTVGNEAVFTKTAVPEHGLTGMDLVRLAVERASSAAEAVAVLRGLLQSWVQGGSCGYEDAGFRYFSSFLIADRRTAYVLETCGREIAALQVPVGSSYAISNGLSLPELATRHSHVVYSWASRCQLRRNQTLSHLAQIAQDPGRGRDAVRDRGNETLRALFRMLREHGDGATAAGGTGSIQYSPLTGGLSAPCVHAAGLLASSQTTASWVSQLGGEGGDRHFVTATAAPCTGLFKPVAVAQPLPAEVLGPVPSDVSETAGPPSLFWQHERLHRAVLQDPARLLPLYAGERDALESRWLSQSVESATAFAQGAIQLADWTARVETDLADRQRRGERSIETRPAYVEHYFRLRSARAGLLPGQRRSLRPAWRD